METCFNYCEPKTAFFSSDERKWITHIRKLAKKNPEVMIIKQPEENDGCIYCKLPAEWLKVSPPRKLNLSEEQREISRKRMRELQAKMKNA